MKLNPQQAPLYGDCVVTVLLSEEDKVEDDVAFYLVFSGSSLRHCASTRRVSSHTLETIAPGHDCCETVRVLLCASREGLPVLVVAEEDFQFVQDEAYDAAQFLATSAGNQQALNFTRFLDRSGPLSGDVDALDEKVALAFRHLKLPAEWNVLGADQTLPDGAPRETLMHFAVRLGLLRLTWFLLQQPGGRGALSVHNREGATPVSLALERGYHQLHRLLTQENAGEPDSWSSLSYEIPCGDCSVRHHRELDVYTLTAESGPQHAPLPPGDARTGHISRLRDIQQRLSKTSLPQMDGPLPPAATAQEPPSVAPSGPAAEGPCASEPTAGQQLAAADAEGAPGCPRGPAAGQTGQSSTRSRVAREGNTECPRQEKRKHVEREGEEEALLMARVDAGPASEPPPRAGSRAPGPEPSAAEAAGQEAPGGSDCVPRGELPGPAPAVPLGTEAHVPETAGPAQPGPGTPEVTVPRAEPVAGESAGDPACEAQVASQPAEGAGQPGSAPAVPLGGGGRPAASSPGPSDDGDASTEKAADTDAVPGVPPPAAEPRVWEGPGADPPFAGAGEVRAADGSPPPGSGASSAHVQSPRGTSASGSAAGQAEHGRPLGPRPAAGGSPPQPAACSARPPARPVSPGPVGAAAQGPADPPPPGHVSRQEGRAGDRSLEASSADTPEVGPHPRPVTPTAEGLGAGQAVTPERTCSPAARAGCGSVATEDDVLALVPSQRERGTAAPEPRRAADCGDGPGRDGPGRDQLLLADRAAGLPAPAMGNTSPAGPPEEDQARCPSPASAELSLEGSAGRCPPPAGATGAPESVAAAEGTILGASGSPEARGRGGRAHAAASSSPKAAPPPSGASPGEQGAPSGPEALGLRGDPGAGARAGATAPGHSAPGAPLAGPHPEAAHSQEVGPRPPEGGAAYSRVPPGAGPDASDPERSGPPALPALRPPCPPPPALDVDGRGARAPARSSVCELSGNAWDVAGADAPPGPAGGSSPDPPVPEPPLSPQESVSPAAPPAPADGGATAQRPAGVLPGGQEERLEAAEPLGPGGPPEEARGAGWRAPLQLATRPPSAEPGPAGPEDRTLPGAAPATAAPLPAGAIEETASRIVAAVIERVTASAVLMAEGGSPRRPLAGPCESGPAAGPQAGTGPSGEDAADPCTGLCAARPEPELDLDLDLGLEPEPLLLPQTAGAPEPPAEMPDAKAEDEADFGGPSRESSASEPGAAGGSVLPGPEARPGPEAQAINRESWCTIDPCPNAAAKSPECGAFLDVGLGGSCASKRAVLRGESGSDSDLFRSPAEDVDSILFSKPEEERLACDTSGSGSSTDDTASLDRHSSHGSDLSLPQLAAVSRSRLPQGLDGLCGQGLGAEGRASEPPGAGDVEEEEMDSITDVPAGGSVLRSSLRPLSPFRRHSWGPGKNAAGDAEMSQRSSVRLLGDVVRRPPAHRRSFSLEGLAGGAGIGTKPSSSLEMSSAGAKELRRPLSGEERGGSLVSLSEEDLESDQPEHRGMFEPQTRHRSKPQAFNYCTSAISSPLTKSISLMTISHPGLDSSRPFHSIGANLTESITEENYSFLPPSPSKKDFEGKSGTKVSRTFSYIKNKMSSSKKSKEKEKDKERTREKEKESKDKDRKTVNGHAFSSLPAVGPVSCSQCAKPVASKDAYACANCSAFVHKGCRETLTSCAKVKMKQPRGSLQAHDTSSLPTVIMRNKTSQPKERPRSAVLAEETGAAPLFPSRWPQQSVSLSKSVSIQNIAGVGSDEGMTSTWKFLSHSTDSLNKISKVTASTESLTDEGTDMNEGQLMGDFELESRQLEAESWSRVVDSKFLKQQKKEVVKRQEVLYELMQTELHHIRTLKIMSDVYSRGMTADLLFEPQTVERLFPCLGELISIHSQFFQRILERKKESLVDKSDKNFLIKRMGDVLVNQFSGENAERLKKTYGKFCGQHTQSVNYFKDLYAKDKRFQAFVKKKMSSAVVRRLGIPECILLVTQRITKYPVLLQRILQCTKDNDAEQEDLAQSLSLAKEVIGAVDSKVASYEKKVRLSEIYAKTDSKSIMRMKSGQMFAKEDLKRKKLVRDGSVFLRSAAGRLKEVQAVLLTDVLVFLQEKDQKFVFAALDQKSTVISLKKLIVREVAHEEKGLFLISMGVKDPEMVEVHAGSREERNSWVQTIQDTINTLNRDEDEGIPSENEEEKRLVDARARELREQLQQKDQQILLLLEEKEVIFRDMSECATPLPEEEGSPAPSPRGLFRCSTEEALRGGPLMKSAIDQVEILQGLVSGGLGGGLGPVVSSPAEPDGTVGPVSLPRRAETFGGFDSHQMSASKGEKEDGDDGQDLRRTESDSGLQKGGSGNVVFMLKRNSEQVIQSVVHLHELLSSLQAVVLQQDSCLEEQRLQLAERALARGAARPGSLAEQEKQRSLEKRRQDLAELQRQRAQQQDEQRRRARAWEAQERALQEREARVAAREAEVGRGLLELERGREELRQHQAAYQGELERLRQAQRQLEREQERLQLQRDAAEAGQAQASHPHGRLLRIPSFLPSPEECAPAPAASKPGTPDPDLSASPKRNSLSRTHRDKGPFHVLTSTGQAGRAPEAQSQAAAPAPARLFGLAKPKDKKEKKKKGKGGRAQSSDGPASEGPAEGEEIFC